VQGSAGGEAASTHFSGLTEEENRITFILQYIEIGYVLM
jgi:hypothetical protein